jgi:hypothetical protein
VTEQERAPRKPGRPRKSGGRRNATVRFTHDRYNVLIKEADYHGRSVSEEVEARVEQSFTNAVLEEIQHGLKELQSEKIGIIAELLNVAAGRIQELATHIRELQDQTIDENVIERVVERVVERAVERAVERVFAKMKDAKK